MRNRDLTDQQWALLQPLLPPPKRRGRPRAEDRRTLNGILYVLRTGIPWNDLPQRYGDDSTGWRRLAAWEADGTWERIWQTFLSTLDQQGKLEWTEAFLDGSFVPAKKGERSSATDVRAREASAT
jgi:transposase